MTEYLEAQYKILDESREEHGLVTLGSMASFTWNDDPKRLLFVLARYKFAARMLEGCKNVLEVGCGDGFAARIVKQHVGKLVLSDADPRMLAEASKVFSSRFPIETICHNFVHKPMANLQHKFDGAYMLDVLEHIPKELEPNFLENICDTLSSKAKVVIGIPSIESQTYASPGSKAGHINCKTKEDLFISLSKIFSTVTTFSMNDEVVHTGFNRMANYLLAVCTR
jgi:SAM-dependent methyltransferase